MTAKSDVDPGQLDWSILNLLMTGVKAAHYERGGRQEGRCSTSKNPVRPISGEVFDEFDFNLLWRWPTSILTKRANPAYAAPCQLDTMRSFVY